MSAVGGGGFGSGGGGTNGSGGFRRRSRTTSLPQTALAWDAVSHDIPPEECELYSFEWRMLAKIIDRIFYWLFVFASMAALGSMFGSIPHKNLT